MPRQGFISTPLNRLGGLMDSYLLRSSPIVDFPSLSRFSLAGKPASFFTALNVRPSFRLVCTDHIFCLVASQQRKLGVVFCADYWKSFITSSSTTTVLTLS